MANKDNQQPDITRRYINSLLNGHGEAILALFAPAADPSIHEPMAGHVHGREAVIKFVQQRHSWLAERNTTVEHLRTTSVAERAVGEYVLHLELDGGLYPLPYAVVAEAAESGSLTEIRAYHSMWPIIGAHEVRRAILPPAEHRVLQNVIARYQKALAEGGVEAIVETFEADGYFREPAGGVHIYQGTAALTAFMARILAPGGITLEHCTVTDDGVACAIEFNAVAFGEEDLIPQAGVAVYERGPSGLLYAARIYDDVNVEALAG